MNTGEKSFASLRRLAREAVRRIRPEVLYPTPNSSLQPERLYVYLDALWQTREVPGAVVEIGCWLGGTAHSASSLLRRTGYPKRYVCVDTFGGFVQEQYDGAEDDRHMFERSSVEMVRRLLDRWGSPEVELVPGDICTLDPALIPHPISVALIDVDLEAPVVASLELVAPQMSPGGIVLVDDCPEDTSWAGARRGYERWCAEVGRTSEYLFGMGIARWRPAGVQGQ